MILDILQHVPSKVPTYLTLTVAGISWYHAIIFRGIGSSCLWLDHSDSEALVKIAD